MMKTAIFLYLHSKNFYQALRKYLHLPHPNTIKSYFGILDTPGSETDCRSTIATVFNKLTVKKCTKSVLTKFT